MFVDVSHLYSINLTLIVVMLSVVALNVVAPLVWGQFNERGGLMV